MSDDLCFKVGRLPRKVFEVESREGLLHDAVEAGDTNVVPTTPGRVTSVDNETWSPLVRELFARVYDVDVEGIPDEELTDGKRWAQSLHHQADSVKEFAEMVGACRGDEYKASMGAAYAAVAVNQWMKANNVQPPTQDPDEAQAHMDALEAIVSENDGATTPQILEAQANAQRAVKQANQQAQAIQDATQDPLAGVQLRNMLRAATNKAVDEIATNESCTDALSWGSGSNPMQRRAVRKALIASPTLKRIAEIAGRLRLRAVRKQKEKLCYKPEETYAVSVGSDLQRLTPSELGNLATPLGTAALYRRVTEGSAQIYELRGRDTRDRGPIVFLIDASGSMNGLRTDWARGVGLAMMEVARIQKREFVIGYFQDSVSFSKTFDPKQHVDQAALFEVLAWHGGGGTNIAAALTWAAEHQATKARGADVVLITDGEDGTPMDRPLARLKEMGASLYTIAIDAQIANKPLLDASSQHVYVRAAEMTKAGDEKLDGLLSI